VILAAPVRNHMAELHASEKRCVDAAVDKRRAEFSTGRILAARALHLLDVPAQAILKGANNEPVWPAGTVGSITHSSQMCVVALAYDHVCDGIGLDVENCDAEVSNVAHLILRKDELTKEVRQGGAKYDDSVRLAFSAKESVFKAVFAQMKRFIEFEEVSLKFDAARQTFSAAAPDDNRLNSLLTPGKGGYISFDNLLVTGFYLPVSPQH